MKTTKMLKLFGVVCASVLLLAACGNNEKKDKKATVDLPEARFSPDEKIPSWQKDTNHPSKLTWYVNFDWYAQPGWGKDIVTKKIKEDMNIEVEFVSGNDENLNTMLASGDLPDIMTFDKNIKAAQEAEKFAIPLNTLAEKYDPYFLKEATKPESVKWFTQEDGNLYGYPSFSTTVADYEKGNVQTDQVFIVRKDIYEKLGKPDMSTPEGFLEALKKAKELQPTSDDGAPLVPFGVTALDIANGGDGALGGTLQDFLNIPVLNGDEWNDRDADKDYQKWLETFRQAYNDGYITNDQFSDNDNTMKEKLAQGRYFAYLHSNTKGLNEFMSNNNARNPEQTYIAIDGPKNSKGEESTFSGGAIGGWTQTFITKDCKDPQKAIELLTYLASQYGTMVTTFGVEGETYHLDDNGEVVYAEEIENLRNADIARFDKEVGLGSYWFVSNDNYALEKGAKPATSIRQMVEWGKDKAAPRFEIEDIDPKTGSEARSLTKMNTDRVQALVSYIQAKSPEEGKKIWDDFLKNRENNNFGKIKEYRDEKIKENKKKLLND